MQKYKSNEKMAYVPTITEQEKHFCGYYRKINRAAFTLAWTDFANGGSDFCLLQPW